MKQIDLGPTGYRKQREGRWVQNINKPLCRWMAIGALVFIAVICYTQPPSTAAMALCVMVGVAIGGLWVLSLKSTDW